MTDTGTADFSGDRPLATPQEDALNRAPFGRRIANVLRELPKGASLVVGVHGPWGDGKTTVLNFVRAELAASPTTLPVDFNPWRFTDESAMLAGFFRVLADKISATLSTKREVVAGWIEVAGRYGAMVEGRAGKVAELAKAKARPDLEELRRRLTEALAKADKRIVILVDDIDRLDRHETHTLFRLIKACADFPNISYVLAFDDTAVAQALGERYEGGDERAGRAFLEKIIQVPLKLPVAAKEDLRALCFDQVNRALDAAGIELPREEAGEFVAGFDQGVAVRLTTPRAAKRYGNGLLFALPMLKGETNPVDLLLVEALRAFFPEVYDIVREHHVHFSGVEPERQARGAGAARSAALLKPILETMLPEHAEAVTRLLIDLFPRVSGAVGRMSYGSEWLARWSRGRRISAPEYCPRYFTYAISPGDIPDAELAALVDAATQGDDAVVERLLTTRLVGRSARRLIEKLRAVEDTIHVDAAERLATRISALATNIPNPRALFPFAEPPAQAAILISHLLRRIPDRAVRVAAATRVVAAAHPLWFGAEVVEWLYVTDKPEKAEANTLDAAETMEVRRALVDRIKAAVALGEVLFESELPQQRALLFEWWRAEGREATQAYLVGLFQKEPSQIVKFLQAMAPSAWADGSVVPRVGELGADQVKSIKAVIDLDVIARLVRQHCSGDLENPKWDFVDSRPLEQRLPEQFMFVYLKWQKEGEPPDAV
jgi:predicted KAP-like P-loop ATPase